MEESLKTTEGISPIERIERSFSLRESYRNETGKPVININYEFYVEYVLWLENKINNMYHIQKKLL